MKKLAIISTLLIMGCTTPKTPQQDVYTMLAVGYGSALEAEITYDNLPLCEQSTSTLLCSTENVKKTVRLADDVAYTALKAAETAVRTPGFATDKTTTIIASAQAAITAFSNITETLKVK